MTGDEVYRGHHQLDVVEGGAEKTDDAEGVQFERYAVQCLYRNVLHDHFSIVFALFKSIGYVIYI